MSDAAGRGEYRGCTTFIESFEHPEPRTATKRCAPLAQRPFLNPSSRLVERLKERHTR